MSHLRRILALVLAVAAGVVMLSAPASAVTTGDSSANVTVNLFGAAADRCC